MADFLRIVVSGKPFPSVSKQSLIESSLYYRALLGGKYRDSYKPVYKFSGWSTKAFELLLQYIITGRIVLKGLQLDVIRTALEMSVYLTVDEFKVDLIRTLITSWTDMETPTAFQLAEELGAFVALREYSFIRVLSAVEREQNSSFPGLNFDALILASGMEDFWNHHKDIFETYEDRWNKVMRRCREILELSLKLPPNASKSRALTANLRIHWFHEPYRDDMLGILDYSQAVSRCLRYGFEEHLLESRQNLRKVFSHVRVAFGHCDNNRGVSEFNMNNWCWDVKVYKDSSQTYQSVMNRNYATFLCDTGLFVIRKCNKYPKIIKNEKLGEIMVRSSPDVSCCVSGRFIFFLECSNEVVIPVLYKYDVFSNEFSECTIVPVERAKLKGHGDILYIVGYSVNSIEDMSTFCVMEYKIKTGEISAVARSSSFGFSVEDLLVVKRKLFVFGKEAYTVVDTLQKEDQELEIRAYAGFVYDMWEFELLDLTQTSNQIYMFLKVTDNNWCTFQLMVAKFDPITAEILCLGFIPTATDTVEMYFQCPYGDKYKAQIEVRRHRDGTPSDSQETLKELRKFN